jgi:O-antigen ligase
MKKLIDFTYKLPFLIILSSITMIVWYFKIEAIGIPVILGLVFLVLVFSKDTMPTVPLFLNALFMVSTMPRAFDQIAPHLYIVPLIIISGMILHIFIYKVKFLKGKMTIGVLLMFAAMLLSSINANKLSLMYWFYASIALLYAIIYLFYVNTIQGDHIKYLLQLMMILGLLISFQTLIYYLQVDDFFYAAENKLINLGWGFSNYIATYLIMFISVTCYYIRTSKLWFVWFILGFFQVTMLVLTISRGGILAFAILSPLLIFLTLFKVKKVWRYLLLGAVMSGLILWIGYMNLDVVNAILARNNGLLLDDTGRFAIWLDALQKFKDHPLLGGGIFAREIGIYDYNMFHNTILHTLGTMGLVGLVSLCIQLYQQFKITLGKFKLENLFLAVALLGAHIHGMVDNVYFMPQFMVLMLLIVSVVEVSNKPKTEELKLTA